MPERSRKTKPRPTPVQRKAEARRAEKLALIRKQVKEGSLVIRKMTAAERRAFPARPREGKTRR
jgi:hypothetical protein